MSIVTQIIKLDGVDTPKLTFYNDKLIEIYKYVLRKDHGTWTNTVGFEMEADAQYYIQHEEYVYFYVVQNDLVRELSSHELFKISITTQEITSVNI